MGANIGYFTLEFARSVGFQGKVLSFEPHPEIFKVLQRNVSRNKYQNVSLQNVACGEEATFSKLYFSTENEGNHKIVENSSSNDSVKTKVVKLSTFLETHPPRLIKMDIEGAELEALSGAKETLCKFKPNLAISIYHSLEDFTGIAPWIDKLDLGYNFHIRHFTIHQEETVLFASTE